MTDKILIKSEKNLDYFGFVSVMMRSSTNYELHGRKRYK